MEESAYLLALIKDLSRSNLKMKENGQEGPSVAKRRVACIVFSVADMVETEHVHATS